MYPNQGCQNCNRLHAQISDMIRQLQELQNDNSRKDAVIRNQQANVEMAHKQLEEAGEKIKTVEALASDKWKMVALAMDMEMPERGPAQEYQGPVRYTAEYVFGGVTKLRAQNTILQETVRVLKERVGLQQMTFDAGLKQLGAAMAESLLQLPAPAPGQPLQAEFVDQD